MRAIIVLSWVGLLCGAIVGAEPGKAGTEVKLPLVEVLVAPGQAVVTRKGKVEAQAGEYHVRVGGLPPALLSETLRVDAGPGAQVRSASLVLISTREVQPEEIRAVSKKINDTEQELRQLNDRHQVLGAELGVMQAFRPGSMKTNDAPAALTSVGKGKPSSREAQSLNSGACAGLALDPQSWLAIIRFVGKRAETTRQAITRVVARKSEVQARLNELRQQLGELRTTTVPARLVADIVLSVKQAGRIPLRLQYSVGHVNWYPVYELRATADGRQINLERQALVAQNTGENWQGARLTLLTLPPERAVDIPELSAWRIALQDLHGAVESSDFGNTRPSEEVIRDLADLPGPEALWTLRHGIPVTMRSMQRAFDYEDKLALEAVRLGRASLPGVGGRFGWRSGGGRRNLIARGGGSRRTESSVSSGLKFLYKRQRQDGSWNDTTSERNTVGLTSFSLLAFLGAGNSSKFGKYKRTVAKAQAWLIRSMWSNGRIGSCLLDQAMATCALSESFGMGGDPRARDAAMRGLHHLDRLLRLRIALLIPGLRGTVYPNGVENLAHAAMAVKSAGTAGLPVPPSLVKSLGILCRQIEKSYAGHRAAASVALTYNFLGASHTRTARFMPMILKNLPAWESGRFNLAYCNVATMACFQQGIRAEAWRKWNHAIKKMLMDPRHKKSWPAEDSWLGPLHSRVGTTALCSQMLEVYYRYYASDRSGSSEPQDDNDQGWVPVMPQAASKGRLFRFMVKGLRTVRSDGKFHRIPIDHCRVKAKCLHISTPVVYRGVFLQSEIVNPFAEPLLEGSARVFLGHEFMGEIRLPGAEKGELIQVPLGEDPYVLIKRVVREKAGKVKDGSGLMTLAMDISIQVENRRNFAVRVRLGDRLAISRDTRVRIRNVMLKGAGARPVTRNGIAVWEFEIGAGKTAKVSAHYEVEYPKGITPGLASREAGSNAYRMDTQIRSPVPNRFQFPGTQVPPDDENAGW